MDFSQKISFVSAILIGIFIFYISSLEFSSAKVGSGFCYICLIYHFSIFFLFGFFLFLSVKFNRKEIWIIFLICLVYAGLDELHQYFVPGRFPSGLDIFMDFLGSFFSFLFLGFISLFRRKNASWEDLNYNEKINGRAGT